MRTRPRAIFLVPLVSLQLFLCLPSLWAKPKVAVRVRMDEGIGKNQPHDQISRSGMGGDGSLMQGQVFFLNVTVFFDNAEALAKNDGKWCIKGDTFLESFDYHGTLDGNDLELEIPQKNGKTKKQTFKVFDRKWRKLSDI